MLEALKSYSFGKIATLQGAFCVSLCAFASSAASAQGGPPALAGNAPPPPQAAAVGYTVNTFSSRFAQQSIDLSNTQSPGFSWYLSRFYGYHPVDPQALAFNPDGSITINDNGSNINYSIATAAPSQGVNHWTGTAFGGGGYFEAVFKFNPQDVVKANFKHWPAFWSVPIEALANLSTWQWSGQAPGFKHHIEVDFFEYDLLGYNYPPNNYGATFHEWYGQENATCKSHFCDVSKPEAKLPRVTAKGTDFTQYHGIGFLWLPATDKRLGYGQFFFDNQPMGPKIPWSKFNNQAPTSGPAPWTLGVLDQEHLALILGTGANEPMTIRSVNVWQSSAANNLSQ